MGYLVFKRQQNQTIKIGDNITIIVASGSAKIGVDAPRDMPVHRGEVYDRIQERGTDDQQPE